MGPRFLGPRAKGPGHKAPRAHGPQGTRAQVPRRAQASGPVSLLGGRPKENKDGKGGRKAPQSPEPEDPRGQGPRAQGPKGPKEHGPGRTKMERVGKTESKQKVEPILRTKGGP